MIVLALETSCDETACGDPLRQARLAGQRSGFPDRHPRAYGGVVPEVASRNHLTQIRPVIDAALRHAGAPGTNRCGGRNRRPGLATSLMIGMSAAKGFALGLGKPFLAINHIEGHLLSPFFGKEMRTSVGWSSAAATRFWWISRGLAATGCWVRRATTRRARPSTRWASC